MRYLLILLLFTGCTFYRHDIEPNRDSKTYWSFAKDIMVDANDVSVISKSKNGKLYTPYGVGEIGD